MPTLFWPKATGRSTQPITGGPRRSCTSLVFAQPDNRAARELQADAYEQMGYQIEGPQWRGIFLTAARELREGALPASFATASPDTIMAMPIDILFDFAAVHVNGEEAAKVDLRVNFTFTDLNETWTAWVKRGVLNARKDAVGDAQLTIPVVLQPAAASQLARAGNPAQRQRICARNPGRGDGRVRSQLQHRHSMSAGSSRPDVTSAFDSFPTKALISC